MQVLTWVPQNDILAHPNLRVFLSHVGINSMYEVKAAEWLQVPDNYLQEEAVQHGLC